jgi:hypothetical protein
MALSAHTKSDAASRISSRRALRDMARAGGTKVGAAMELGGATEGGATERGAAEAGATEAGLAGRATLGAAALAGVCGSGVRKVGAG